MNDYEYYRPGQRYGAHTSDYRWRCQECGHTFKTAKAAQKAAFGDRGCPKCGGSDIDMSLPLDAAKLHKQN